MVDLGTGPDRSLNDRIADYLAVDRAERAYRPFRSGLLAVGLLMLMWFGAPIWLTGFYLAHLAIDFSYGWHNKARERPGAARSMRVLRLLQLHQIAVFVIYACAPIFLALTDRSVFQQIAVLMLFAQAINMIAVDTRSPDRSVVSLVGVVGVAQLMALILGAQTDSDLGEQILINVGTALVSLFYIQVARSSAKTYQDLQDRTRALVRAQKGETVGRLTTGIAHDFNNLLTVMRGNLDLLPEIPPEERQRTLEEISAAAERGGELVGQLMDRTRPGKGKRQALDVQDFLDRFGRFARRVLPSNVTLTVEQMEPLQLQTDAAQMEASLLNLVINARDAMPEGGSIRILAAAAERDGVPGTAICVADTGPGMSSELVAKAHLPYVTTKETSHGTGLGLAMVKTFTEGENGVFSIDSEVGRGTMIELWLPSRT